MGTFPLEIQSSYEKHLTTRLARYNAGLFWTFQQRVLTLGSVSKGDCPPAGGSYFRGIGLSAPGTVPF